MYVYDTETCGLHGPIVLIQYQLVDPYGVNDYSNDDIVLHEVWRTPIKDTLSLIEDLVLQGTIGFNLAFDHFHLCQTYTSLLLLQERVGPDALPQDHIELYAELEPLGRDGPCLKPAHAFDLMLYARKGPYQSTMERKNITIKRIPTMIARDLQSKLDEVIKLNDIYFARRKERKELNWDVESVDSVFSNLTLRFKPSAALKVLAQDALGIKDVIKLSDISPSVQPIEVGWAPFATALSSAEKRWDCKVKRSGGWKRGKAWPGVIRHHISFWAFHSKAREYARDDITYTRDLYFKFRDDDPSLEIDDNNSILACQVAAARWRGFAINIEGIKKLRNEAYIRAMSAPKAPSRVYQYLEPYLSEADKAVMAGSTKKAILEELARRKLPCMECDGSGDTGGLMSILESTEPTPCTHCGGLGHTNEPAPVSRYAKEVLDARTAMKEVENWDKLLTAGRFHASNKIIGTLSDRMSGSDGLNAQGIKHDKYVRKQFQLAHGDLVLCGGDFMSFEVSIIDALCDDPKLNEELRRCAKCKGVWPLELYATQIDCPHCGESDGNEPCRQKFHGLFAMGLNPGMSYDDVVATKGSKNDLYDKGKRGGFAKFYGGNENTLVDRGVADSIEVAASTMQWFDTEFPGSRKFSEEIFNDFCSMRQPGGIGTKVEWHDPKDYVESMLGFRRYFTAENQICKKLFDLANNLPKNWKEINLTVVRRDREQKVGGAIMSALFASAFSIQARNMRAAGNHRIQSTGATITKELQVRLWGLQPVGVHKWHIQPMNVHDEIMCPMLPELKQEAKSIVDQLVQDYRYLIPLIAISWGTDLESWADK